MAHSIGIDLHKATSADDVERNRRELALVTEERDVWKKSLDVIFQDAGSEMVSSTRIGTVPGHR
jgi:hypothetical protein